MAEETVLTAMRRKTRSHRLIFFQAANNAYRDMEKSQMGLETWQVLVIVAVGIIGIVWGVMILVDIRNM